MTSHKTIPALTATFKECLVPLWGISMQKWEIFNTSSLIPSTSFPKTNAILSWGNTNSLSKRLLWVCSILIIWWPHSLSWWIQLDVLEKYFHLTESVAPKAVRSISLSGGQADIPQRKILPMPNASQIRNIEPMFCLLLILSSTTVILSLALLLNSEGEILFNSEVVFFIKVRCFLQK